MKTKQKNLLMNLLEYWGDYYSTTIGKVITWDPPVKTSGGKWYVDVYEKGETSNNFEYITKIHMAINTSCFMSKEQDGFRYHIF